MRLLPLLVALSLGAAAAQTAPVVVTGLVTDAETGEPLPGATVLLTAADSTQTGAATGADGAVRFIVAPGAYRLRVSFVGYGPLEREVTASGERLRLGTLALAPEAAELGGVAVEGTRRRVEVRGDTTAFNADAFPVNPDANVQDLVEKLPGVQVENGTVTAEGEQVQRVLVDGREFFGTDVRAALQNLPAEIVQEIQVFDRASEESRFSGFDDGNAEKTINIVTRPGMRNGQFGRAYAGAGPDGRYLAGGNATALARERRITVVGLANNVDQQNFATEDLLGIASGGGRGRGGRGRGRRGGRGGGDVGTLLLDDADGVASANSFGVSYSDRLAGGRLQLTGSAFANATGTDLDAVLTRATLADGAVAQLYDETDRADRDNANLRASLRAQVRFSDRTEATLEPRVTAQTYGAESSLLGQTLTPAGAPLAQTTTATDAASRALRAEGNARLRHRFAEGRTLSLGLGSELSDSRGETTQTVAVLADEDDLTDQLFDADARTRQLSARLSYTEPLAGGQVQLSYRPGLSRSTQDQLAFLADDAGAYTVPDREFTSAFTQRSVVQRAGLSYRYGDRGFNVQAGVDLQHESLTGEGAAPEAFAVDGRYLSVLPSARVRMTLGEGRRLGADYRVRTRTPSAAQLSPLVDNANPLLLSTGNPGLRPSTEHPLRSRFNLTDAEGGSVLFGFLSGTLGQNYISTATTLATRPTTTASGVTIPAGGQLTRPENVDGYLAARGLVSYGRPLALLRSNANVSLGASLTRAPGLVNGETNVSDQFGVDGRVFVGSAISPEVDFSLEYGARYSAVANTQAPTLDQTTVRHLAGAGGTFRPGAGLVLATDLRALHYTGLDDLVDPTQVLWGARVGYTFFPGDVAEVSLSVNDILDQQRDVERTVTELYIEDAESNALGRFVLVNLSYRLRTFGEGTGDPDARGPRNGRRGGFGRGE